MSDGLNTLLERDLSRSARAFDNARTTYRVIRNGLFGLGFSVAIFLPIASSEKPQSPAGKQSPQTVIRNEVNYSGGTVHEDNQEVQPQTTESSKVHLDLVNYEIQFAPPITREWHRTTFSRNGDEFWALPDASFVMRFSRSGRGSFGGCWRDTCSGSFSFQSQRYRQADAPLLNAWVVNGREISIHADLANCSLITADVLTDIVQCKFVALGGTGVSANSTLLDDKPNLCIWMRRSEHLEDAQEEKETVAMDIRWSRIGADEGCPNLYKR